MTLLAAVNGRGLLASRPAAAAANEGWIYYATDAGTLTRSNGASWDSYSTGFSNPMTSTGDLIYSLDGSGTPARRAIGSSGDVFTVSGGVPVWAAPAGGSITKANADGSATTLSSATTQFDVTGASVSLAAGTWIIWGVFMGKRGSTDTYILGEIADGSNNLVASSRGFVNTSSAFVTLTAIAVVTPGSTTTYKLRAYATSGTTATIEAHDNQVGTQVTRIVAIKVA